MRTYISGQITGIPFEAARERFNEMEELVTSLGMEAVNPLKNGLTVSHSWNEHIVKDIETLLECDAILMLDGWKLSKGARIEYNIASECGLKVLFESILFENKKVITNIKTAIHEVTGLKLTDYNNKDRCNDAFFARMVFAYQCDKRGVKLATIVEYVNRDRTTILHYLKKYPDELKYNANFREIAEKVEERMKR